MELFESECVGGCPPSAADDSSQRPAGCGHEAECGAGCEADVNDDGRVNVGDLLLVLGAFGWRPVDQGSECSAIAGELSISGLPEDINRDCVVGVADLLLALSAFGADC